MQTAEGVIQYHLEHTPAPPRTWPQLGALHAWRTLLFRLELVGQGAARYGGLGYGNLSVRLQATGSGVVPPFLITATQTGHLPVLEPEHYTVVRYADPSHNWLRAEGPARPSSEALTHAAVYAADGSVEAVIHVHSPQIWCRWQELGLAAVPMGIGYGTPEMARAVGAYVASPPGRTAPILVMRGHEDGVVCWGETLEAAGLELVRVWTRAVALEAGMGLDRRDGQG